MVACSMVYCYFDNVKDFDFGSKLLKEVGK